MNNSKLNAAAKAAGITREEFVRRVGGLLRNKRCRDTSAKIFTDRVIDAIS